jgi:hypothetical protein
MDTKLSKKRRHRNKIVMLLGHERLVHIGYRRFASGRLLSTNIVATRLGVHLNPAMTIITTIISCLQGCSLW